MVFVCFALKPLTNHTAYRIKSKLPAMPFRIPTTKTLDFALPHLFSTLHATNHSQVSLLLLLNNHPHWLLSQCFFSGHSVCLFVSKIFPVTQVLLFIQTQFKSHPSVNSLIIPALEERLLFGIPMERTVCTMNVEHMPAGPDTYSCQENVHHPIQVVSIPWAGNVPGCMPFCNFNS